MSCSINNHNLFSFFFRHYKAERVTNLLNLCISQSCTILKHLGRPGDNPMLSITPSRNHKLCLQLYYLNYHDISYPKLAHIRMAHVFEWLEACAAAWHIIESDTALVRSVFSSPRIQMRSFVAASFTDAVDDKKSNQSVEIECLGLGLIVFVLVWTAICKQIARHIQESPCSIYKKWFTNPNEQTRIDL